MIIGSEESFFYPAPTGPILSVYAYADTASVTDKAAAELSSAIESANGGSTDDTDLSGIFIEIQSRGGLEELKSPVLQLLYRRMSTSDNLYEAMMGVSGLLRQGDATALALALALAPKIETDPRRYDALPPTIRTFFRPTDAPLRWRLWAKPRPTVATETGSCAKPAPGRSPRSIPRKRCRISPRSSMTPMQRRAKVGRQRVERIRKYLPDAGDSRQPGKDGLARLPARTFLEELVGGQPGGSGLLNR